MFEKASSGLYDQMTRYAYTIYSSTCDLSKDLPFSRCEFGKFVSASARRVRHTNGVLLEKRERERERERERRLFFVSRYREIEICRYREIEICR